MIENYIGRCELCGSRNICKPCAGPQAQDDGDLSIFDRTGEVAPMIRDGEEQRKRTAWHKKRCQGHKK